MSVRRQSADHDLIRRARQLRRDMTAPERLIWYALRDRRLAGCKFRRQVVIGPYIVDFYSHAASLVLEIDGDSHADRGASDRAREAWLEGLGCGWSESPMTRSSMAWRELLKESPRYSAATRCERRP